MCKPVIRFHNWWVFFSNSQIICDFGLIVTKDFLLLRRQFPIFWCYNSCTSRSSQVKVRKCCNISDLRNKHRHYLRELIFEGVLFDQFLNIADSVLLVYLKGKYLGKSHKILPSTLTCCSLSKKKIP